MLILYETPFHKALYVTQEHCVSFLFQSSLLPIIICKNSNVPNSCFTKIGFYATCGGIINITINIAVIVIIIIIIIIITISIINIIIIIVVVVIIIIQR